MGMVIGLALMLAIGLKLAFRDGSRGVGMGLLGVCILVGLFLLVAHVHLV